MKHFDLNKKQQKVMLIIVFALGCLTLLLPYMDLTGSEFQKVMTGGSGSIGKALSAVMPQLGNIEIPETIIRMAGWEQIKMVIQTSFAMKWLILILLLVPVILNIAGIVLTAAEKIVYKKLIFIPAVNIILYLILFYEMPEVISSIVQNTVADELSSSGIIGGSILSSAADSEIFSTFLRNIVGQLRVPLAGYGLWAAVGCQAVIVIIIVLGIVRRKTMMEGSVEAGELLGIKGSVMDMEFPMEGEEVIVIGRNPASCHIILEEEEISKVHCKVSFDEKICQYRLIDCSSSGCFLAGGTRLPLGEEVIIKPGTEVYLGGREVAFRLK